jgi:hypothetical protein
MTIERRRPASQRKPTPAIACLPKKPLLYNPPLKHRGINPEGKLSVFEMALATAVVARARAQWARARHRVALKAGKAAAPRSKEERQEAGALAARADRIDLDYGVKEQMSDAYETKRLSARPPKEIAIEASSSALLNDAGPSDNPRNIAQVPRALRALARPVRAGEDNWPPLLIAKERGPNNRWRLTVDGRWLPRNRFGVVSLPIPTRGNGTVTAALYLWLPSVDDRRGSRTSIAVEKLADILGIAYRKPADIFRALDRALRSVNTHLEKEIGYERLIAEQRPTFWKFTKLDGGKRLRFEPTYVNPREEEPVPKQRVTTKAKATQSTEEELDPAHVEEIRQLMREMETEGKAAEDSPEQAGTRRWLNMTPRERDTARALGEQSPLTAWGRKMTEEDLREQEFDGE